MDFGMTIPNYGPLARRDAIVAIAGQSEALGFNIMAIADHIVIPKTWNSFYPYSPTGWVDAFDGGDCLEPLALMAALALATEKAQLLTAVLWCLSPAHLDGQAARDDRRPLRGAGHRRLRDGLDARGVRGDRCPAL